MYFSDVIGQELVKKKLISTVLENRVSHGFVDFEPFNLPLKSHLFKLSRNDINVYEHETYMLCLHFVITSAIKSAVDM